MAKDARKLAAYAGAWVRASSESSPQHLARCRAAPSPPERKGKRPDGLRGERQRTPPDAQRWYHAPSAKCEPAIGRPAVRTPATLPVWRRAH